MNLYSVLSTILVFILSIFIFFSFPFFLSKSMIIFEWEFFLFKSINFVLYFYYDIYSFMFMSIVILISASILKYSQYYMDSEFFYKRFIIILLLFVVSMGLLISSPNFISLLLGWDGLGLTSYILVIYYQNEKSESAGFLTVMSNRFGDACILTSIGLLFSLGSWSMMSYSDKIDEITLFMILLGAMTKSAQLPFSAWLPAAMAAPTPVSSLVHSSTLVTAGVYLLIRSFELMKDTYTSNFMCFIGVLTMFMSGLSANFEKDLKKIVALSTLSQLGLMFMILGAQQPEMAFLHLSTHALFKATLFMCVGVLIHSNFSSQDSRMISDSNFKSPMLMVILNTSNLALVGFPFMTGFYSKDLILEFMSINTSNIFLSLVVLMSTGFTLSYSLRMAYLSMGVIYKNKILSLSSDLNLVVTKSILTLFTMSMLGGFIFSWLIFPLNYMFSMFEVQKFSVMFLFFMIVLYFWKISIWHNNKILNTLFISSYYLMWFIFYISTKLTSKIFLLEGWKSTKFLDMGWYELWSGQGGQKMFMNLNYMIQKSSWIFSFKYLFELMIIILLILIFI